ncbi:hypothetical protein C5167_000076 [Papaver somniferum]|uniref:Uncharacterized protein n=1 Tax=Papaver somniferum TaxID=3469 RepID=A0A4Y7KU32_PAPSO|nr:hypothetical protein C5167_000076 [Papaver somniferum]
MKIERLMLVDAAEIEKKELILLVEVRVSEDYEFEVVLLLIRREKWLSYGVCDGDGAMQNGSDAGYKSNKVEAAAESGDG